MLGSVPSLAGEHTSNVKRNKLILNPALLGVLPAAPSTRPAMTRDHLSCCVAFLLPQPLPMLTLTAGCYKLVVALQSPALAWPPGNGMV